ncbi:MAG: hypothetical protein AAF962_00670 [Actinomycetota bacterium]
MGIDRAERRRATGGVSGRRASPAPHLGRLTGRPDRLDRPSWRSRLALAAVGPVPVTLVGLSTFGWFSFPRLAIVAIPPAVLLLVIVLRTDRAARRPATHALIAGLIATFLYDLLRWSFLLLGWMDRDPIPHLGTALGLEPGWVFGYLWRFVGNGGGLALTFVALGAGGRRLGAVYGLAVCSGLLAVLVWAPNGQADLFPLTGATLVVAVGGHLTYGVVLGTLVRYRRRPGGGCTGPRPRRSARVEDAARGS